MTDIRVVEVNIEQGKDRHNEYFVCPDGLVKTTQLRILGRALTNFTYDPELDNIEGIGELRDALSNFFS